MSKPLTAVLGPALNATDGLGLGGRDKQVSRKESTNSENTRADQGQHIRTSDHEHKPAKVGQCAKSMRTPGESDAHDNCVLLTKSMRTPDESNL